MTKTSPKISGGWWLVILIVVLMVGLFVVKALKPSPYSNKTTREVALTCTTDMATEFHIHPNLKIIIDGKEELIPDNIGIQPTCMTSLHTHDASGKLHVESPEKRDFTLADFFAVWQKPFNKDQILDYKVAGQYQIREMVNGKEVQDFEKTVLRDNDQIIIYYEKKK